MTSKRESRRGHYVGSVIIDPPSILRWILRIRVVVSNYFSLVLFLFPLLTKL